MCCDVGVCVFVDVVCVVVFVGMFGVSVVEWFEVCVLDDGVVSVVVSVVVFVVGVVGMVMSLECEMDVCEVVFADKVRA